MKTTVQLTILFFLSFFSNTLFSQDYYAGIEIGFRGIKVNIIDVRDVSKKIWVSEKAWTDYNIKESGILNTGLLSESYIQSVSKKVLENYNLLINDSKIDKSKIVIVISSGISKATNTTILIKKIFDLTTVNPSITTTSNEAEYVFNECVPKKLAKDCFLINIASQNTKGGFYENQNGQSVFNDFYFKNGILSYFEKTHNGNLNSNTSDFIKEIEANQSKLSDEIKTQVHLEEITASKKNIVFVGGAVWSFFTLYYKDNSYKEMYEIKYEDILKHDENLKNNFPDYLDYAIKDKEADKVIKTFTQQNLIAANAILIGMLNTIKKVNSKKLFFVKLQDVPWLSTYIIESLNAKK